MSEEVKGRSPFEVDRDQQAPSPDTLLTLEVRKFAREFVDRLLERCATFTREDITEQIARVEDAQALLTIVRENSQLLTGFSPEKLEAVFRFLERRSASFDETTKIPKKDLLDERLRFKALDIALEHDPKQQDYMMRHCALETSDGRGLKVINEAASHSAGDQNLARVALEMTYFHENVWRPLVGEHASIELYRDGGDEFTTFVDNTEVDLQDLVTLENFDNFFDGIPEIEYYPDMVKKVIKMKTGGINKMEEVLPTTLKKDIEKFGTMGLSIDRLDIRKIARDILETLLRDSGKTGVVFMEFITKLKQEVLSYCTCEDIIATKTIVEHLRKGNPEYDNPALKGFKMPLLMACGAVTGYQAFRETKGEYIKKGYAVGSLGGEQVVTLLMSIFRRATDQRGTEAKKEQTETWTESDEPLFQLWADFISRNEVTISYAQELRALKPQLARLMEVLEQQTLDQRHTAVENTRLQQEIEHVRSEVKRFENLFDDLYKLYEVEQKKNEELDIEIENLKNRFEKLKEKLRGLQKIFHLREDSSDEE